MLPSPTNVTGDIYKISCELLEGTWRRDPIRLIGIRLGSLQDEAVKQVSLFEQEQDIHAEELQEVIDQINEKYGNLKVMPASMKKISKE